MALKFAISGPFIFRQFGRTVEAKLTNWFSADVILDVLVSIYGFGGNHIISMKGHSLSSWQVGHCCVPGCMNCDRGHVHCNIEFPLGCCINIIEQLDASFTRFIYQACYYAPRCWSLYKAINVKYLPGKWR